MTRFTVLWWPPAKDDLSLLWMESSDRQWIADAANQIDRELATDPGQKGWEVHEESRVLALEPLTVHFSVIEEDRCVTVWSVQQS